MKKQLYYTCLLLFFVLNLKAQNCEPDSSIDANVYSGWQISPEPDTSFGNFPLPMGCIGEDYSTTFTFVVSDTVLPPDPFIDGLWPFEIRYLRIDSVVGLPPGVTYLCEPDSCIFVNTIACLSIIGNPVEAGVFFPVIHATYLIDAFWIPKIYSFKNTIPYDPENSTEYWSLNGEYRIHICPETLCNSCTVDVNDALKNIVSIQQNNPNPFRQNTNIVIHSKESNTFDFRVINMVGEIVYNEQIYLISGENNISFDGNKLSSGVYFYSIGKDGNYSSKKMIVSRGT